MMTREKDKKPGREQLLLEAARLGQVDQLETLLNQFQQLKTKKRSNPLSSLRKCVGPNTIRDPVTGFTCLHHAALNGHSQAVRLIVTYGGRLNAVDYKGSSALHLAAWSGNLQVVKTLVSYLEAPGTIGERGGNQSTSLSASSETAATTSTSDSHDSARTQSAAQTKQQIKSSSPKQSEHTSQQAAAFPDAGDCALRQQKLEIDHRNNDNQTALSLAAQFGHSQVAAELLAHGADPNLRNNQLESPLDLACLNGHLDTVRVLLSSSAILVESLRKPHATISISAKPHGHVQQASQEDDQARAKRYTSASGWSSLLRGTTMKDLSPTSDRSHKAQRRATMAPGGQQTSKQQMTAASHQHSLDSSMPTVSERLLDHSPVHYAVRRAHLAIVDLLLNYYEANIYQLTSLGSVMHELVMGNHSFRDTTRGESSKHYPHSDMMRVFLARLSRMSAGDPNETRTRWQHLLSARNGQQRNVFDMLNDINNRTAQELRSAILDISEHLEHHLNWQGQQLSHQPVNPLGQRQQVFNNSQHLNSFVTLKRAPKQQTFKLTRTRDDDESQPDRKQAILVDGTQTIGRRKISAKSQAQPANDLSHLNYQFDQAEIGRSKSSLGQDDNHQVMSHPADTERPSTINWPALSIQQSQHYAQQSNQRQPMLNQNSQAGRKKRSKSRDLGSILKEVNQNGGTSADREQLYDNQLLPSMGQQQLSSNYLVRSQTDCTHLLGRLFGQHESQQQAALNGDRLSGSEHRTHAPDLTRQQYQQQNQHAHSSENSSLISGLDQERLVPTSIAHQHSATLDRRAINRHYHVYEHEFYPPRLVTATQGNKPAMGYHASERTKQVVAIVPPLVHNPARSVDGTHRFPRADDAHATNNSRLSLDAENIAGHHHQDQMNRFVGRSTRKSTGGQLGGGGGGDRSRQNAAIVDTSHGGYDSEQQPRPSTLMPRPRSMHSSQSLESRLGADSQQSLSFENTRRALMRDFNKMIGSELLNTNGGKYSDQSSDGGQSSHSRRMVNSTSSSSQNSILTGVSLDMDTRGEHLTVSGTRITMPDMQDMPPVGTLTNPSVSSGSIRSSPPSNRASQRVSPRDSSAQTTRLSSQHTQTGSDNLSESSLASSVDRNRREPPPQKPPRPSLESQQIYKALRMGRRTMSDLKQQGSPVIYDVPSHNNSLSNLADPATGPRRPGSRTSINSSNALMLTSSGEGPPARPPQPKPRRSGVGNDFGGEQQQQQQQVSITQPPTERPPPPPVPPASALQSSPLVPGPLEVLTATSKLDRLKGALAPNLKLSLSSSSSCNSPTSSTSSSFKPLHNQRPDTFLGNQNKSEIRNIVRATTDIIQPAEGADSGVCTSNSPASTSRDSESGRHALELSFGYLDHSKQSCGGPGSVIMAPPSPRTAQMSIEEAFMPLEETTTLEVANQTKPVGCSSDFDCDHEDGSGSAHKLCFELDEEIEQATSFELGSQVDEIFGWLGSTNRSLEGPQLKVTSSAPIKADYENCADLQDRLRASRCRSIGDLFRGIASEPRDRHELSGRSTATTGSSVILDPDRSCSSEEGDYAATSETQGVDHPEYSAVENLSPSLEAQPVVSSEQNFSRCMTTPGGHCKEIMVRVVVDESQNASNGNDVFYINPLELKKISSKVDVAFESTNMVHSHAGQRSEAETLTDEELCASVDKSSGYIRFTLRKRQATSVDASDTHIDPQQQPVQQYSEQRQVLELNDPFQLLESTSAKRTKLIGDKKEEKTNEKLPEPVEASQRESNETMQQVIEHEERKERVGPRKASGDSISMDISQVSSSSSTSEMSIKSIVSLKAQRSESGSIDAVQAPTLIESVDSKQNETVNVKRQDPETDCSHEPAPTPVPVPVSVAQSLPPKQVDKKKVDDQFEEVKKTHVGPKVVNSLVSETARRLEAAAAARATNGPAPTAAARRVLNRNSSNGETLGCDKENMRAPALPPKKAICWPPKKATDDNVDKPVAPRKVDADVNDETAVIKTTTSTPTGPVIGRVSANRLSFQKLIEEKSKAAAAANNTLSRPKPPPPVKPAGLIVPQSFKS